MKKGLYCYLAIFLMGLLIMFAPGIFQTEQERSAEKELLVIWMKEGESDVAAWLKKAAAVYEKKTGQRVYLRYASEDERRLTGENKPDALIPAEEGALLAYRGWAMVMSDETKPVMTPVPAPSLFIRPSMPPAADLSTLAPLKKVPEKVAVPERFSSIVDNSYVSQTPLSDLSSGKADAALLTPFQVQQMKGGYSVQVCPAYFVPVRGMAVTEGGQAFLSFLRSDEIQRALTEMRLFSWMRDLFLYGADDELLHQMEKSR